MKKPGFWTLAMPISVVFLGAVYYVKVPEVRKAVDEKTPIVHSLLGRFVQDPKPKVIVMKAEQDPAFSKSKPARETATPKPVMTPAPMVAKAPEPVAPPVAPVAPPPVTPPPPAPVDWQKIASDRSKWPKKVVLAKPATFAAVLNGKIVGSLVAPAGAEANIIQMKDDKLGLEFNGGGGWVPAVDTDLLARLGGAGGQ